MLEEILAAAQYPRAGRHKSIRGSQIQPKTLNWEFLRILHLKGSLVVVQSATGMTYSMGNSGLNNFCKFRTFRATPHGM
jgi:hypothetical protein